MVYLGRIVGVGRTVNGNALAVYAISGRNEDSKTRYLETQPSSFPERVKVKPLGKMTKEQREKRNIYFYHPIRTFRELRDGIGTPSPYLAISNGYHTDLIASGRKARSTRSLRNVLEDLGPEPDSLLTPRIAGEIIFFGTGFQDIAYMNLGIAAKSTESGENVIDSYHVVDVGTDKNIKRGNVALISTYGGSEIPTAPQFELLEDVARTIDLNAKTSLEAADHLFDYMDREFVVSTAAAEYRDGRWQLAVRNRKEP